MEIHQTILGGIKLELSQTETIGLYKLCLDIKDHDSEQIRAALQVRLSKIIEE